MNGNIDTVREALDFTLAFLHDQYGYNNGSEVDFYGDSLSPEARETRDKIVSALAALPAIDPEAIRREARVEGIKLAAAAARKYLDGLPYYEGSYTNGLHTAILGAEPTPCRGNECEQFDCEVCDSRKKPAQDDGKPEEKS